ncbi:hypothetical protein BCR37DRAFT_389785 [Protomyces lactucae-debilis]|uniref:Uncharacterized protein n=1 Tax=Protomyces lactucae-debilis TaxID=2754530 RepID=A0A1Y2EUH7_PROLT|nr:uncharacterized protein BCR37DRAFT_389785 [Protomyces lactucae-debilis]ORY74816.1 hypothetical protein BCR37DRAFT_389785 [Protomyces lactucae-debilis]
MFTARLIVSTYLCLSINISLEVINVGSVKAADTNTAASSSSQSQVGQTNDTEPSGFCKLIYTKLNPDVMLHGGRFRPTCELTCADHFADMMWNLASIVHPCQRVTMSPWDVMLVHHPQPKGPKSESDFTRCTSDFRVCIDDWCTCLPPLVACSCSVEVLLHRVSINNAGVPQSPGYCDSEAVIKLLTHLLSTQSKGPSLSTGPSNVAERFSTPIDLQSNIACDTIADYSTSSNVYALYEQLTKSLPATESNRPPLEPGICTLKYQLGGQSRLAEQYKPTWGFLTGNLIKCHPRSANDPSLSNIRDNLNDMRRAVAESRLPNDFWNL